MIIDLSPVRKPFNAMSDLKDDVMFRYKMLDNKTKYQINKTSKNCFSMALLLTVMSVGFEEVEPYLRYNNINHSEFLVRTFDGYGPLTMTPAQIFISLLSMLSVY